MKYNSKNLPNDIPLFPLPGALLLPKSKLPLNLFEPKYLTMLDDALKTENRLIGMIQPVSTPEGTQGSAGRCLRPKRAACRKAPRGTWHVHVVSFCTVCHSTSRL